MVEQNNNKQFIETFNKNVKPSSETVTFKHPFEMNKMTSDMLAKSPSRNSDGNDIKMKLLLFLVQKTQKIDDIHSMVMGFNNKVDDVEIILKNLQELTTELNKNMLENTLENINSSIDEYHYVLQQFLKKKKRPDPTAEIRNGGGGGPTTT